MFNIGDKVFKNRNNWLANDFDKWGRGMGIGEVVDIVDDDSIDVRWPGGRCYEFINQVEKVIEEQFQLGSLVYAECLAYMSTLKSGSVDMILCDLPYQKTKNSWDSIINMDELWAQYKRVIKSNGAIILFGQDKFSAKLMLSNEKWHRYNLIWEKTTPTGHLNAKKMPMRSHEDMLIFYNKLPTYNPQKTKGHVRKISSAKHKRNSKITTNYGEHGLTSYDSTERYPRSVWKYATDRQKSALHPTQKPLALCVELVKTYSNEGDLILDNCSGSGTTAMACIETNRKFICIDNEMEFHDKALNRLK